MAAHVRARANTYNYLVAFFVALGSFTYGFNSAIIGSVIGLPSFYAYFDFVATSSYGGSIIGASNGLYTGGGVIGCWTVNWLSDKLGRRMAIQIIVLICIVSAALQTGSVAIGKSSCFSKRCISNSRKCFSVFQAWRSIREHYLHRLCAPAIPVRVVPAIPITC